MDPTQVLICDNLLFTDDRPLTVSGSRLPSPPPRTYRDRQSFPPTDLWLSYDEHSAHLAIAARKAQY
jgi:hypothetical protein